MLSRDSIVRCPWCDKTSTLGEWNDNTYAQCTNREMKRDFMPLMDERAFKKNSVSFYMCPLCKKWSRGSKLVLKTNRNNKIDELGGCNLVEIVKDNNKY